MAKTTAETEMETQDTIGLVGEADLSSVQSLDDDKPKDDNKEDNDDTVDSKLDDLINGDDSDFGVARLLQEGTEFDSYDAFQATLQQYSDTTFAKFAHQDSSTIERLGNVKEYNKNIVYSHVVFACIYGGKKMPSRSSGIRNCSSRKIGCPVKLRLGTTPDKQRLIIKESKLDCHNHDLSEENYRFKSLDEETELEIYKLISMHENKRVARQLVRDKLAKETGKNVNMKDISNIEKRVSKKIDKQTLTVVDKEEEEGQTSPRAAEDESNDRTEDMRTEDMSEDEEEEEKDEHNSLPKVASPSTAKSPVRPKRHIREPRRFRDADGSKTAPELEATPVAVTGDEERAMKTRTPRVALSRVKVASEIPASDSTPLEASSVKVERRGRKRKVQLDPKPVEEVTPETDVIGVDKKSVEDDRKSEIRERKLVIQEELLVLEKKKMEMLQDIATKLDKILENQGKG